MDDKYGSDLISLKELVLLSLALIPYSSLNVVNAQLKATVLLKCLLIRVPSRNAYNEYNADFCFCFYLSCISHIVHTTFTIRASFKYQKRLDSQKQKTEVC